MSREGNSEKGITASQELADVRERWLRLDGEVEASAGESRGHRQREQRWVRRQDEVCAAVWLVATRAWAEGDMGRCLEALTLQKNIQEGLLKVFVASMQARYRREGAGGGGRAEKAIELPALGLQKQPDLSGLTDEQIAQLASVGEEPVKRKPGRPKGYPVSGVGLKVKIAKQERLRREAEEAEGLRGSTESDVEADRGGGGAVQPEDDGAFARLLRRVPTDAG